MGCIIRLKLRLSVHDYFVVSVLTRDYIFHFAVTDNQIHSHSLYLTATDSIILITDLIPLTPNDPYMGRTAQLTSKIAFYIFIQQIQVLNILNMVYTLRVFLFKTQFVS